MRLIAGVEGVHTHLLSVLVIESGKVNALTNTSCVAMMSSAHPRD